MKLLIPEFVIGVFSFFLFVITASVLLVHACAC